MKLNFGSRFLFIVLCVSPWVSSTLTAQVCGTVVDQKTHLPVSGVHIYLGGDELVAISNQEGKFCLQQSAEIREEDLLTFSHISYTGKEILLSDFRDAGLVVFLTEGRHALGEVVIRSDRFLEGKVRYRKLASMRYGVSSFGSLLLEDCIYVIGGDETRKDEVRDIQNSDYSLRTLGSCTAEVKSWERYSNYLFRYDIRNNRWETLNQKFRKRAYHAIHHYDDKIYILGGKRLSENRRLEYLDETVEIYDLKKDTIIIDPVNPHQAVDFASCMYDGNILVMGGSTKMSRKRHQALYQQGTFV